MKRLNSKWSFGIGILVGCMTAVLAILIWLWPAVSFKKHGEIIFTDYPKGIKTVTFENDLVDISVTDLAFHRDVPFELNLIATCKDREYGSIWGSPYEGHFFFEYKNLTNGLNGLFTSPPINDVHRIHPSTKIKLEAQQVMPLNRP